MSEQPTNSQSESISMQPYISALLDYFSYELPKLEKNYEWKIPKIAGFKYSGKSDYLSNVALKKFLHECWNKTNGDSERLMLASLVVKDWGGVKNNKPGTLKKYVDALNADLPHTPIKGVASYSKIFSIADLDRFAIYDARVAACLNAVQWNSKIKGLAFNYISGRNNTTGHSGKRIGFVYQDKFKIDSLISCGWQTIDKDKTYETYLSLLKECHSHFRNYNLYDLEMVLFANAETVCRKAMETING
jgi:hypothetical protein